MIDELIKTYEEEYFFDTPQERELALKEFAKDVLKIVESNLLFPFEGTLVKGKEIDRPKVIGMQRTAFNRIMRET